MTVKVRMMLFALAAVCGVLALSSESSGVQAIPYPPVQEAATGTSNSGPGEEPEFFAPSEDAQKFVYNLPFYMPGKTPAGELEWDPVPFEELLPHDKNREEPQPIAMPTAWTP